MRYLIFLIIMMLSTQVFAGTLGTYEVKGKRRVIQEKGSPYWELRVEYTHPDGVTKKEILERVYDDQVDDGSSTREQKIKDYLKFRLGKIRGKMTKEASAPDGSKITSVMGEGIQDIDNEVVKIGVQRMRVRVGNTKQTSVFYEWLDESITIQTDGLSNYQSGDITIATVNASGVVTGVSEGSTQISVDTPMGNAVGFVRVSA